jgi:hypothetical protein
MALNFTPRVKNADTPLNKRFGGFQKPVWTVLEKRKWCVPSGIRKPDRPARGQSLMSSLLHK